MSRRKKAQPLDEGAPEDDSLRAAVLTVALFFAVVLFIVVGVVIYALVRQEPGPPRAAIVDQLSLSAPNPDFVEEAATGLLQAGYTVDYYSGEQVTVDFYRGLPKRGYDLIILRAHAARHQDQGELTDNAHLFTGEPYSLTKHVKEQREERVTLSLYDDADLVDDSLRLGFFGISADFVRSSMKGGFGGATVILMGCDVLRAESLAEAFVQNGADVLVGWDGPVSASHTDAATLNLLQHMIDENLPPQEAAAAAMAEVGPDPFYDSVLLSYPPES